MDDATRTNPSETVNTGSLPNPTHMGDAVDETTRPLDNPLETGNIGSQSEDVVDDAIVPSLLETGKKGSQSNSPHMGDVVDAQQNTNSSQTRDNDVLRKSRSASSF